MSKHVSKFLLPTILLVLTGVSVTRIVNDWQAFLFPTIVLVLMLLTCFGWLNNSETENNGESLRLIPVAVILFYCFLLPFIGIWLATILFVVILQVILDRRIKGIKLGGSIIFASLLIILFERVLAVTFPVGSLWI